MQSPRPATSRPSTSLAAGRVSIRWVLAAAVAGPAFGLFATSVQAQYQINQDGSARDANNRVGANGRNTGGAGRVLNGGVTANQIVNGNVTGGKEFRGPTASGDARAFRGNTAGLVSDNFIRNSSGGFDYQSAGTSNTAKPFYGESRATQAPTGYVPSVNVYSSGQTANLPGTTTFSQPLNAGNLGSLSTGEGLVPKIGTTTTIIGGPADQANTSSGSYLVLTPLSGIRAITPDQLGSYTIRGSQIVPNSTTSDRFRTTDAELVDKMRSELSGDKTLPPGQQPQNAGYGPGQPAPAVDPNAPRPLNGQIGPAPEAPVNKPLDPQQLNSQLAAPQQMSGGVQTGQSIRRTLIVPAQQSQQYSELEKRLRQTQGADQQPQTDQQAAQDQRDIRPLAPYAKPGMPGVSQVPATPGAPGSVPGTPGASPLTPSLPGAGAVGGAAPTLPPVPPATVTPPAAPSPGPAGKVEPLVVTSLATGVASPTQAQVLRQAEEDMKQGRFNSALDRYSVAEQAAPNNPLIALGRANAELGSTSYRTAESHLRQAFAADPALLMGRYDLRAFLGQEKLEALVKDLTGLAEKNGNDPMPPFLLAYIHHGLGDNAQAASRLNEVNRRQGGAGDATVTAMRKHWGLPDNTLNK